MILSAVAFRGLLGRLSILIGVLVGYLAAVLRGEIDFTPVADASWVGLPTSTTPANPVTHPQLWGVLPAFLPVVLALVAENVGHIRGVAQMTDDPRINRSTGRALIADGLSTMIAGCGGGSGTTTYGENIGVMAATRVYSTAAYWIAGSVAILLGLSPKIGATVNTITPGVLGGVTVALYGMIGVIGMKIWRDNQVDFSAPVNQFTAAVALIIGIGDFTLTPGERELLRDRAGQPRGRGGLPPDAPDRPSPGDVRDRVDPARRRGLTFLDPPGTVTRDRERPAGLALRGESAVLDLCGAVVQPPGSQHTADGPAEMGLPGDAELGGQHTEDHAAVEEQDGDRDDDLYRSPIEGTPRDQIGQPAHDQPTGAQHDRMRGSQQPGAEAGADHADHRGGQPANEAAQCHQETKDRERE